MTAASLSTYLRRKDRDLAASLDTLWLLSNPIHGRQNRPDSNENGHLHVRMVDRNIWRFLCESHNRDRAHHLNRITSSELFLLSGAACCHDFDKALKSALPPNFRHGEGSADFLRENHERLGLSRPWADAIALAISIHDLKANEFREKLCQLRKDHKTPNDPVDLQLIALLLKTADILHTDCSRISTLGVNVTRLSEADKQKYLNRYSVDGWGADGSRVVIQATPATPDHRDAVRKGFDFLKRNEWTAVAGDLQRLGFPYELHLDDGEASLRAPDFPGTSRPSDKDTAVVPATDSDKPPPHVRKEERVQIKLVIQGKLSAFDDSNRRDFLRHLGTITGARISDIRIVHIREGGVEVLLELPRGAAQSLREIAAQEPAMLVSIGILRLGEGAEEIGITIEKPDVRQFMEQKWEAIAEEITTSFEAEEDFMALLRRAHCDTARLHGHTFAARVNSFLHRCIYNEPDEVVQKAFRALAEHSKHGPQIHAAVALLEIASPGN